MRAGISDCIVDKVVREIWIVRMTIEGELQDAHPRQTKLVAQGPHVSRNHTQIFRYEWQMAELGLYCLKKAGSRTRHPLPGLSRWRSGWNVPRSREPTEVIHANHIDVSQQSTQPIDAPAITSRTHGIPVVNRIAPQLTLRAEIIGRNSGDEARPMLLIEQEQFRVRPNITGIRGNKERQIADQAHAPGMGMLLDLIGLAEQQELREADLINLTR